MPVLTVVLLGCRTPTEPEPSATQPEARVEPPEPTPESGSSPTVPAPDAPSRLALEAEFHRTRVATGAGYWALGVVHNPLSHPVTDVRASLRMIDEAGTVVGRAEAALLTPLEAGGRAPVAIAVTKPVEHEHLELSADAVAIDAIEVPTIELEHDAPQRAELGGYFVLGQVANTGSTVAEGLRIEVQGLDDEGRLLGVDWLALEPLAAGETRPFDIGGLRYEISPDRFVLVIRSTRE